MLLGEKYPGTQWRVGAANYSHRKSGQIAFHETDDDGVMKMQARYTDPLKTVRSPLSTTPYSSVFTVSTTPYHCVCDLCLSCLLCSPLCSVELHPSTTTYTPYKLRGPHFATQTAIATLSCLSCSLLFANRIAATLRSLQTSARRLRALGVPPTGTGRLAGRCRWRASTYPAAEARAARAPP